MNRETIAKAIEAEAVKADDLAKRKRDQGLQTARDRAAWRAEGLRQAARMVRDIPTTPTDATFQGDPLPEQRTPETVLRAMLRAYEEKAIELRAELWRSDVVPTDLDGFEAAIVSIRNALGSVIAKAEEMGYLGRRALA